MLIYKMKKTMQDSLKPHINQIYSTERQHQQDKHILNCYDKTKVETMNGKKKTEVVILFLFSIVLIIFCVF